MDNGLGDADTLAEAFGQLADDLVFHIGNGCAFADFIDARGDLRGWDPFQFGDEGEVLADIHFRVERRGLRQVADVLFDVERLIDDIETGHAGFAFGGREEAGEDAHRGGFAGAVLAEETDDLSLIHFKGDVVDRDMACVSLGQTFDFNHMYCL